jgi:hypothetical protein
MRNFGLIGGTSRALGALSAALAKLATGGPRSAAVLWRLHPCCAETTHSTPADLCQYLPNLSKPPLCAPCAALLTSCCCRSAAAEQQEAKQKRSITDVGDGMLEGAGAFGSSVLRGFRGLIEKPLQGAQQAGVQGLCRGRTDALLLRAVEWCAHPEEQTDCTLSAGSASLPDGLHALLSSVYHAAGATHCRCCQGAGQGAAGRSSQPSERRAGCPQVRRQMQRIAIFLRSMSVLTAVSMSQSLIDQCCIHSPAPCCFHVPKLD